MLAFILVCSLYSHETWVEKQKVGSLKTGYSRFCALDLLMTNVDHIVQILHF